MLTLRAELLGQLLGPVPQACALPKGYRLDVASNRVECGECGARLRVQRTRTRCPITLALGQPTVRHHIQVCSRCGRTSREEGLAPFVPPGGTYGYDLIVKVGLARFVEQRQALEIREQIQAHDHLDLPPTTVLALADSFLDFLEAVHQTHAPQMRAWLSEAGGYVLHLDGTCEAGSPVVFVTLDGRSELVLVAQKIPSENVADIQAVVTQCVSRFGQPLATMRDLSPNIELAREGLVKAGVLKPVPDFICQYHFLANVGERLCQRSHATLTKELRRHKIKSRLTTLRKDLVRFSKGAEPIPAHTFEQLLDDPQIPNTLDKRQLRRYLLFGLVRWLDDSVAELRGEYFPFDQPSLVFYRRCVQMQARVQGLLSAGRLPDTHRQTVETLARILAPVHDDGGLRAAAARLEKAVAVFEQLRHVLRLSPRAGMSLLRQHPSPQTLAHALQAPQRLKDWRSDLGRTHDESADPERRADAKVVLDQLAKYGDQLVGHVITPPGQVDPLVLPRTNHPAECRFGQTKRGWRRRTGTQKLSRHLQGARAAELLVPNLSHEGYLEVVYGGDLSNLASRFAEHSGEALGIRKARSQPDDTGRLRIDKKVLRRPDFPERVELIMNSQLPEPSHHKPIE